METFVVKMRQLVGFNMVVTQEISHNYCLETRDR